MKRISQVVTVALLAISYPCAAVADELQDHVDAAAKLMTTEHYKEALAELEAAYTVRQSPRVLYLIGRAHQALGNTRAAIDAYARFLASDATVGDAVRAEVAGRIASLRSIEGAALAEQRPAADRSFEPPPVRFETRVSRGLMAGGAVLFGVGYLGAVVTSSIGLATQNGCISAPSGPGYYGGNNGGSCTSALASASGTLLIPVVGPFIAALVYRDPVWSINMALVDGAAQVGGLAMMIYAGKNPTRVPVYGENFQLAPYATPRSGGLRVVGHF